MTTFRQELILADDAFPGHLSKQAAEGWEVVAVTIAGHAPAPQSAIMVGNRQQHPALPVMYVLYRREEAKEPQAIPAHAMTYKSVMEPGGGAAMPPLVIEDDIVRLGNRECFHANKGILGLSPDGQLYGGYDDIIDHTCFTPAHRRQIAAHMMAQWRKFGEGQP